VSDTGRLGLGEFVALIALMISLIALAIDAMLPALPVIGADLGVQRANDTQLVISVLFLGMAAGQLFYGPISDSTGRKPPIYAALLLFMVGSLLSIFATTFSVMLAGRFVQGLGVAGPRIVAVALVRDQYEGRAMARIMSFVMAVFILVPAIAPAWGQAILFIADWRAIFVSFLVITVLVLLWFGIRQPETLPLARRTPLSLRRVVGAVVEVCTHRSALGATIAAGLIFGAFLGYLNSSQQIFQETYQQGARFALYFGMLALAVGGAGYVNARLVMGYGMQALTRWALTSASALYALFFVVAWWLNGVPPFWLFMVIMLTGFFGMGILFGNLNTIAMDPMGHIAGVAAAVIASLSTAISLPLGVAIGFSYDGTILPLVGGFAGLSFAALLVMRFTQREATASADPENPTAT
jgi:DHA1 family bicyclomycin/chloramphenicol resistance-like MFS transporter